MALLLLLPLQLRAPILAQDSLDQTRQAAPTRDPNRQPQEALILLHLASLIHSALTDHLPRAPTPDPDRAAPAQRDLPIQVQPPRPPQAPTQVPRLICRPIRESKRRIKRGFLPPKPYLMTNLSKGPNFKRKALTRN